MAKVLSALALAAFVTSTFADCVPLFSDQGVNIRGKNHNAGDVVDAPELCDSQGSGSYTFSMQSFDRSTGVPHDAGDDPSQTSGYTFYIFDNACKLLGAYDTPGDCGLPFTIEGNFLKDVLTITSFTGEVGNPYFSFLYGDGKYSINNNHCGCVADPTFHFPTVAEDCKCAFPVSGVSKRAISFEA